MWVPYQKKKKKNNNKKTKQQSNGWMNDRRSSVRIRDTESFFLNFSLSLFLRFTETCPSDFFGINTKSALRDEGYA